MTCILGYTTGKEVYIAADSLGSNGHYRLIRADDKLFQVGNFIIGGTTSYRMLQLLRYGATHDGKKYSLIDLDYNKKNPEEFMVTEFIDKCRDIFKYGGFIENDPPEIGGEFLVGLRGGFLYKIESDFQVGRSDSGFESCGCGYIAALSSIKTIKEINKKIRPYKDLEAAIGITATMIEGVGGPVKILKI